MENIISYRQLAIIVPVYNVEKYLRPMIQSVITQSFTDFSLILINDGSNDKSLSIIYEIKEKDERVVVINKENQGPGSARNAGLDYIKNSRLKFDYIWFCDSDDLIESKALEKIIGAMNRNHADYGLISVKRFDKVNTKIYHASIDEETLLSNKDIVCQYFRWGVKWRKEPCSEAFLNNKFFRYDKIKGFRFREDVYRAEDFDFFIKVIPFLESGVLVPDAYYLYRLRKSSLTNAMKNTGDLKVCLEHYDNLDSRSIDEKNAIQHKLIRAFYLEICDAWCSCDYARYNRILEEFSLFKFKYKYKATDIKVIILLKLKRMLPVFIKLRNKTKSKRSISDFFE